MYNKIVQWRSSAPKGGGTNFFLEKSEKQKKKGHSGVKAQDRVLGRLIT